MQLCKTFMALLTQNSLCRWDCFHKKILRLGNTNGNLVKICPKQWMKAKYCFARWQCTTLFKGCQECKADCYYFQMYLSHKLNPIPKSFYFFFSFDLFFCGQCFTNSDSAKIMYDNFMTSKFVTFYVTLRCHSKIKALSCERLFNDLTVLIW